MRAVLQTQWAMNDTWVQNNTATLDGGGMHIEGVINYVLQYFNITLYNNTAQNGAALNEAASFLGFTDCLVLNNTGTLYGGGLFAFYSGLTVENATIIGNMYVVVLLRRMVCKPQRLPLSQHAPAAPQRRVWRGRHQDVPGLCGH